MFFNDDKKKSHCAFTLIELFVTIAIIGLLATIILPALAKAKAKAWTTICLNNKYQLGIIWHLYANDNNGELAANCDSGVRAWSLNWVAGVMSWRTEEQVTNYFYLINKQSALFASYCQRKELYKCPVDRYLSPAQKEVGFYERVRSVSMNMYLRPVNPPEGFAYRYNQGAKLFNKLEDITQISPAKLFVFIDEHADYLTEVQFHAPLFLGGKDFAWPRLPASYHNGGCAFAFADGHSELKRWLVKSTIKSVYYGSRNAVRPENDYRDLVWVYERCSTFSPIQY